MRILVTGGCGFIGSNFIRWALAKRPEIEIVNLDKLTYAGNPANLRDLEGSPCYRFVRGDVADPAAVSGAMKDCQGAIHFAAETHVDRSIANASDFLRTNILGTHVLLEEARRQGLQRTLQISTDEVYGSLPQGAAHEESPLAPNSPYAASKAAADHLARAYRITYGVPTLAVRACNNYGPYQFPEKFLPLMITNAMDGEPLPIYGDGQQVREWIYVEDFCEAIDWVWRQGQVGEVYNVGTGEHRVNLELARAVLANLGKPESLLRHVADRPGHDRRYAILSDKIRKLGWSPRHSFEQGLQATIRWYQSHEDWWRPLKKSKAASRV